ncbi:hypothetical protein LTR56_009874 [Elasticomyces elasticus]|nr:hypothetical protein LTR56_009874 [Elasticomyces elasticus]
MWTPLWTRELARPSAETPGLVVSAEDPERIAYRPLDFARLETRFLRLLPLSTDQPSGMLRGILFAASLLEAPTYVAVSYCWGKEDSNALIEIQIAGHPDLMIASITQTLSEALHVLLRRGETLLWVDALCINQRDAYERGQQVLRMSQIYSTAQKDEHTSAGYGSSRKSRKGEKSKFGAARTQFRGSAYVQLPVQTTASQQLTTFEFCEASDQRDKVYALLGMTLDGADVVPLPDYAQPAELVLRRVTEIMIAREGLTATMLLARGRVFSKTTPTWLPDWLSLPRKLPPWIRDCITRERETLTFDTTISGGCLSVAGVELAAFEDVCRQSAIERRYQYLDAFSFTLSHDYYNPLDVLGELWDAITSHQEPSYSHADADIGRKSRAICLLYKLCESSTLDLGTLEFGMDAEGRPFGPKHPAIAGIVSEWLSPTSNLRFRDRPMLAWVLNVQQRLQQDLGDPWFRASAADLEHLVACVDSLYWADMTLAVSSTYSFWIVHHDTNVNDLVYRLVNCDLPVVLRRSGKVFRFVGEMRAPNTQAGWIVNYLKNAEWKQIVIM